MDEISSHILRPTSPLTTEETSWFNTLKQVGGGCNDLVHMLVAMLTTMHKVIEDKRQVGG
jgi:hypothetical protein